MACRRWVPTARSAGTVNSVRATPPELAVTVGSCTSAENSVSATCSPAWKPENTTIWLPPATTDGDAMSSGTAVEGAVAEVGEVGEVGVLEDDGGGVLLALAGAVNVSGTALSSDRTVASSLVVYSEQPPVTQLGSPVTDGRVRVTENFPSAGRSVTWAQPCVGLASGMAPPTHFDRSAGVPEPAHTAT